MSDEYTERLAAASPLAAAAFQLGQVVSAVDQARAIAAAGPAVHRFDDTTEAYNASQCYDEIKDGDLLVVASERAIAVLMGAYPVALTILHGEFHACLEEPARTFREGRYAASVDVAEEVAAELGLALDPTHAARPDGGPAAPAVKSDPGQATPIEIPRMLVETGDILHSFGARLKVVETGVQINPATTEAYWWADVEGVTSDDSRRTYRSRWTIGVPVATAAWDVVTVDRVLSTPTV
ncbi:hypothetical protein OIC43_37075 [Streptomyces sp. NBC_00825]|uniref:hypothetical protein n=1 Tax=unclassified Streptomyces TaxID=2593676 RepID=UPI002ED4E289|nr:hypothetical protein OG832_06615 [Streptomyces sp. NBC_00826]WTH94250.1 hypothetical protein OIC43_37075 [Streptomyces sp. NBC_00825]WTI02985.1 hypothetical protein OHA23_37055 [Streptomyces sp. NBC_00822]